MRELRSAVVVIAGLGLLAAGCAAPAHQVVRPPPKPGSARVSTDPQVLLKGPAQLDEAAFTADGTQPEHPPRLWISREQDCSDGFDVDAPKVESGAIRWPRIVVEAGRLLCGSAESAGTLAFQTSLPEIHDEQRLENPSGFSRRAPPPGGHHSVLGQDQGLHGDDPGAPGQGQSPTF